MSFEFVSLLVRLSGMVVFACLYLAFLMALSGYWRAVWFMLALIVVLFIITPFGRYG